MHLLKAYVVATLIFTNLLVHDDTPNIEGMQQVGSDFPCTIESENAPTLVAVCKAFLGKQKQHVIAVYDLRTKELIFLARPTADGTFDKIWPATNQEKKTKEIKI